MHLHTTSAFRTTIMLFAFCLCTLCATSQNRLIQLDTIPYSTYPHVHDFRPDLPSPFQSDDGKEFVVAVTQEKKYAIIPVTLGNAYAIGQQLIVDTLDFPHLAKSGLHDEETLGKINTITDRSTETIFELGRPGALSQAGFMAGDENIISVIKGDNQVVRILGSTHPQLARPLFHVLNMIDTDLALGRWNMAKHRWDNIRYFYYNERRVFVLAEDTKGGQQSIFNDSIEGAFYIRLWRTPDADETAYLQQYYGHLSKPDLGDFMTKLSVMHTGEMQPQYIMRYGFYEGHTFWRTDPITIAFIFNLIPLPELDRLLSRDLPGILHDHYTE